MRSLLISDPMGVVWWGTPVECWSAFARQRREGGLDAREAEAARANLDLLVTHWPEVLATPEVRRRAGLLLRRQGLRAADALQLAAALFFFGDGPGEFVTLDTRLSAAAASEGLTPLSDVA